MSRTLLIFQLWLFAVAGITSAAPPQGPDAWSMMWNDEFEGTAIDSTKWSWGSLPWGGIHHNTSYKSYITPEDSYLSGGSLWLRCRYIGKTVNGVWVPWTEGFVHSNGKFRATYGYVEIRAQFATNKGTWPAFWTLSDGWPPEIDIAELFGGEYYMHHGLATGSDWQNVSWDSAKPSAEGAWNWHLWGLEWGPGFLRWYKDGVAVKTISATKVPGDSMYFILNSGMRDGYDSTTPNPNYCQIDYCRVYQRSEYATNSNFEYDNSPWSRRNGAGTVSTEGVGGSKAMRILTNGTGDGAAEQTIYGLAADTDYVATAAIRSNGWANLTLGVKSFGGTEIANGRSASTWDVVNTPFTTGTTNNSARIYARLASSWATGYVDDLRITRAAAVMNPSLETGEKTSFWTTVGDVFVHNWSAYRRSGDWALRFNNPASERSASQTISGLKPSTTYQWSCWMKANNQGLNLGAKDHGGSDSFTAKTGLNWTWTRHQHSFTTGPSNTQATVYATIPANSVNSVVDIDDFMLSEALPTPWTRIDIGSPGLESEAGLRNNRIVLKAAGADIWNTADSCGFIYQNLKGDGMVTARIRTLEKTDSTAKCGIMLRESTSAGARHVFIGWRPDGKNEWIRRSTANSVPTSTLVDAAVPTWLRLTRKGDVFTAFSSVNGSTWTPFGSPQTLVVPETLLAGMATVSRNTADLTESTADNLSVAVLDSDKDGLHDDWEMQWFGNLSQNGSGDPDADLYDNLAEFIAGTQPTSAASTPSDSDQDGLPDTWEMLYFTNLTATAAQDPDNDGFTNAIEAAAAANPLSLLSTPGDTDADGLSDIWEQSIFKNLDATGSGDADLDGASNLREFLANTQPLASDSFPPVAGPSRVLVAANNTTAPRPIYQIPVDGEVWGKPEPWSSLPVLQNAQGIAVGTNRIFVTALNKLYRVTYDGSSAVEIPLSGLTGVTRQLRLGPDGLLYLTTVFGGQSGLWRVAQDGSGLVNLIPASGTGPGGTWSFINGTSQGNAIGFDWMPRAAGGFEIWVILRGAVTGGSAAGLHRFTSSGSYLGLVSSLITPTALEWIPGEYRFLAGRISGSAPRLQTIQLAPATITTVTGWNTEVAGTVMGFAEIAGKPYAAIYEGTVRRVDAAATTVFNITDITGDSTDRLGYLAELSADTDSDGLPDDWELREFGHLDQNGGGDADRDWISNRLEFDAGSNPKVMEASADADADGLPDAWEMQFFGNRSNIGSGDFDHDGSTQKTEYALALDPNNPTSSFAITITRDTLGAVILSWPSREGISFTVRSSDDLILWSTLESVVIGKANENTATWRTPEQATGRKFYRVEFSN